MVVSCTQQGSGLPPSGTEELLAKSDYCFFSCNPDMFPPAERSCTWCCSVPLIPMKLLTCLSSGLRVCRSRSHQEDAMSHLGRLYLTWAKDLEAQGTFFLEDPCCGQLHHLQALCWALSWCFFEMKRSHKPPAEMKRQRKFIKWCSWVNISIWSQQGLVVYHNMLLVGHCCRHEDVTSHQKSVHTNGDNAPSSSYINVLSFIGFPTAVLASCWSLIAKTVQKQRWGSSADVHDSS